MISIKQEIVNSLKKALQEVGIEGIEPQLEIPNDETHGDYSSNIALVAFKKIQDSRFKNHELKTPRELADKIKTILESYFINHNSPAVTAQTAGNGFINFTLSKDAIISSLSSLLSSAKEVKKTSKSSLRGGEATKQSQPLEIAAGSTNPRNDGLEGKRVVVEFTDPNPFKEFHIGHLYSNTVGESLSRLFESQGAIVRRVCYQGDIGLHVAKAIYGLIERFKIQDSRFKNIQEMEDAPLVERVKFMGEAYATGSTAYESDEKAKEEVHTINKKVYQKDAEVYSLYQRGREWSLEYFETIYARLGTKFEGYYFESEVGKDGIDIVKAHINDGIFKQSEGAIIFEGEKYGLHNRVFINSLGLPTYEAKELGLAPKKQQDWPHDMSVILTGNEINEYFKVLLKALSLIEPALAAKTKHLSHGMVRLPSGKMSSRTGTVITGEWLIDEAKMRIMEAYPDMDGDTAEKVAVAAIKYSLLKSSIGKDIEFSFEESVSFNGASGPYLQYTFARTQSVLMKYQISNIQYPINTKMDKEKVDWKFEIGNLKLDIDALKEYSDPETLSKEEISVLRILAKYDDIVEQSAQSFSPSILCAYLFQLAHAFNLFYQQHQILGTANRKVEKVEKVDGVEKENSTLSTDASASSTTSTFRIALTAGVGKRLKDGLHLLGIEAPERM